MYWRRLAYGVSTSPLLSAVSAAVIGLAIVNLSHFVATVDQVDLSALIESGAPPDASELKTLAAQSAADADSRNCSDAASRARLTVTLASLQEADASEDVSDVAPALQGALDAARSRVACAPVDGNASLQWATLALRGSGPTPDVVDGLTRSALFAPSEAWIVAPRLDVAAKLVSAGVGELALLLAEDLQRFIDFEATSKVAAAYVVQGDILRRRMRPLIQHQPDSRKHAIAAAIDQLGLDFTKP